MDASGHPEIFIPLLGMTIIWLCLIGFLFRKLRLSHPEEFHRLGRPSFQSGSFRVIAWLYLRGHRKLGDGKLSALCDFMALWFTAVQALFLYLVYTVLTTPPPT
jgi:hypothetical protein